MTKAPEHFVISRANLPNGLGIPALIAYWLLLSHFAAPTWGFVMFYLFAAFILLASFVRMVRSTQVDLLAAAQVEESQAPAIPSATDATPNRLTVKATHLAIHRLAGTDLLRLSFRDANGNVLWQFKDYNVAAGDELVLHGVRIETDIQIHQ